MNHDPFDYADVFDAFGLPLEPEFVESLYPFAPVFRIADPAGDLVLKRTCKPFERALALADWEQACLARGIPVVAPVADVPDNPRVWGDEVWVVYPYVPGWPYEVREDQLRGAGALLGRMHAEPEAAPELPDHDWQSIGDMEGDVDRLAATPLRLAPELAGAVLETIAGWAADAPARMAWLEAIGLPEVDCSCDYKANNLVFTDDGPVLIDPDLAGRQPRILDLAQACWLFHNEIGGGGGALLSADEWGVFLDGYFDHVTLTEEEAAAWPEALRHVFLTHGLWLIFNEYEIDAPVQQAFMDDLLASVLDLDHYAL